MLLTSSWKIDLPLFLGIGLYVLYKYISRKHQYWQKRGVPTVRPLPIIGNILDILLFRKTLPEWLRDIYVELGRDVDCFGVYIFERPYLVITNPKLFKYPLIKDFNNFMDRYFAAPDHSPITQNMMFFQKSPQWKIDRNKLSVVFSSGKLKKMFPLMMESVEALIKYLENNQSQVLDAKEVASNYSTSTISRCAFGIDSHCFEEKDSTFKAYGKKVFGFSWRNAFCQSSYILRPDLVKMLKLEFVDLGTQKYFCDSFMDIYNSRKDSNETYNDLVDILKDLEKAEGLNFDGSDVFVCGVAIQMFLAGFETTSSTISFTLYELAKNNEVQNKAREEIYKSIEEYGAITYESVQKMPYLDMCIYETLRKYPIIPFLDRRCQQDYKLPGTDIVIEKDIPVLFPTYALNVDERYYPEPFKYNPNRFETKVDKSDSVFFPFGEGPRICIGERFAKISMKLALSKILHDFEVLPCDKTPKNIKFEPRSIIIQSNVGIPVTFRKFQNVT